MMRTLSFVEAPEGGTPISSLNDFAIMKINDSSVSRGDKCRATGLVFMLDPPARGEGQVPGQDFPRLVTSSRTGAAAGNSSEEPPFRVRVAQVKASRYVYFESMRGRQRWKGIL